MVALWFAALFGLGSLAIRPTLLESFVLAARLDLVVSAAAPPLGFTFRILLALVMFVAGGALGFVLARRIMRGPKPKAEGRSFVSAKAVARNEGPDDDDFARLDSARASQAQTAQPIPGRRRALAMEEDFSLDHHDLAPLPGGVPQILDLADLGPISEYEEPEAEAEQVHEHAAAWNDESLVTEPADPEFDPWQRHAPPAPYEYEAEAAESFAQAEPVDEQRTFAAPAQTFAAPPVAEAPAFAPPASFAAPASFAPPVDFALPDEAPAFAEPVVTEASANFAERPAFAPPVAEPAQTFAAPQPPSCAVPAEEHVPLFAAAVSPVEVIEEPVQVEDAAEAEPALTPAFGQVSGDAAERLVASPLGTLGVVQLAERLALAIARKRGGTTAVEVEAEIAPTFIAPPVPVASPLPPVLAVPPAPAFAPQVEEVAVVEAMVPETAAPAQFAAPPPPFAAPPVQFSAPPEMPAALRPLNFDDHDDEPLEAIVPPRSFAMPQAAPAGIEVAPTAPFVVESAPPVEFDVEVEPEPEAEAAEVADDGYASLIDITSATRPFVRIEEPASESASIEPVVIFPGQQSRPAFAPPTASPPFAAPADPADEVAAADGFSRQFDAPQNPSAPLRMPTAPARAVDPQETERQLKAALATLQRMSGAA